MVKNIAIIPARGGSKRIPYKNIVDFLGKPMIGWTIEAALESNLFSRVLVSTDDVKISEEAKRLGAESPFLRDMYTDDHTPISQATIRALEQAQTFWGEEYSTVTQLMANCPLRGKSSIIDAFNSFEKYQRNFQISCFRFGWMNPWWAVTLDGKQQPSRLFPDAAFQRSQDLPPLYCPTGAIWIARSQLLLLENTFYGTDHCFEPMQWSEAVDIDDYNDLDFAKSVAENKGVIRNNGK